MAVKWLLLLCCVIVNFYAVNCVLAFCDILQYCYYHYTATLYIVLVVLINIQKSGYQTLDQISGYENTHTILENEPNSQGLRSALTAWTS